MHRLKVLAALLLCLPTAVAVAQTTDADLRARCAQLVAFWDRQSGGKSEGSGGAEMIRKGAVADCDAGRFEQGIRSMENLLRRNRYTVPPA